MYSHSVLTVCTYSRNRGILSDWFHSLDDKRTRCQKTPISTVSKATVSRKLVSAPPPASNLAPAWVLSLSSLLHHNSTYLIYTSVLSLRKLRTLCVRTRAFGPRLEKVTSDIRGITFLQYIYIICCCQYYIRNQRTRLPLYNRWNHISRTIPNQGTLATDKRTDRQTTIII